MVQPWVVPDFPHVAIGVAKVADLPPHPGVYSWPQNLRHRPARPRQVGVRQRDLIGGESSPLVSRWPSGWNPASVRRGLQPTPGDYEEGRSNAK
jgi:hypothetical protein